MLIEDLHAASTQRPSHLAVFYLPSPGSSPVCHNYHDFFTRANRLAGWLRSKNLASNPDIGVPLVGIMVDEGPMLPVIMLGVLLARMALVPFDPLDPPQRLSMMLDESQPAVLIAKDDDAPLVGKHRAVFTGLKEIEAACSATNAEHNGISVLAQGDADEEDSSVSHVYYTSGSTGRPKGCIVTRAALLSYCRAKNEAHRVTDTSVCLVASAHTFDPSLGDFLATLLAGGTLAMAPRKMMLPHLGEILKETGATHVLTTPSLFATLDRRFSPPDFSHLRVVALGGEVMPKRIVQEWAPHIALANTYGVTECTVYQAFSILEGRDASARSLGKAMGQCVLSLMSMCEEGADVAGVVRVEEGSGEEGELWIGGPQVGLGYLKRETETKLRFVSHPILGKCFRTGDIFRATAQGWEFVGRRDGQVKLRGRRVELAEIENALQANTGNLLAQVACVVQGKSLVAWCLPTNVKAYTAADVGVRRWRLLTKILRTFCARVLPTALVPAKFVLCEAGLPTTGTGKLDRRTLAEWAVPVDDDADGGEEREERRDAWEEEVAAIWAAELGVVCIRAGSNFLELGGDSLSALRVCRRVADVAKSRGAGGGGEGGDAQGGGVFGEELGALAPAELLKRPDLRQFCVYLRKVLGTSVCGEGCNVPDGAEDGAEEEMLDVEGLLGLLIAAAGVGSTDVVSFLLAEGAKEAQPIGNREGCVMPLHAACLNGHEDAALALLNAGASPNRADPFGRTPLHLAAQKGGVALVKRLLEAKGNVSVRDRDGQGVLHHAARAGASGKVIEMLLDALRKDKTLLKKSRAKDTILEWKDVWDRTPLHWAVINGQASVVSLLLREGANAKAKDKAGETALEMAERRARCGASERADGERASTWANIATLLGGSGTTKNLKEKGYYNDK